MGLFHEASMLRVPVSYRQQYLGATNGRSIGRWHSCLAVSQVQTQLSCHQLHVSEGFEGSKSVIGQSTGIAADQTIHSRAAAVS